MTAKPRAPGGHEELGHVVSRSRAIIDSTTPTSDGEDEQPGERRRPAQPRPERGPRQQHLDDSAPNSEELERAAVEDQPEGGPAVVEDHDLVDHGELEVRVRVVERDAGVLRQQHHEQRRADHQQRGGRRRQACRQRAAEHAGQAQRARCAHQRDEAQEQRRLGEARERHLAAAPMPSKPSRCRARRAPGQKRPSASR